MSIRSDRTLGTLAVAIVLATAAFALLLLVPSRESARSGPVSLEMIRGFLGQTSNSSPSRKVTHWEDRLVEELRAAPDVKRAARKLAPEFSLAVAHAEQLIVAWVRWMHAEHAIAPPSYRRPSSGNVAGDLYRLLREAKFDPHVIKLAAPIVQNLDRCTAATLDHLTGDTTNKREAVWAAANASQYCYEWWLALNKLEPMNDAVLWGTAEAALSIRLSLTIAILEHLDRTTNKTQFTVAQARVWRTSLSRKYLQALLDAGLVREAVDHFSGLPEDIRHILLGEVASKAVVQLGGHDVSLNETADILGFSYTWLPNLRLEMSAALYLAGRGDEARAIFKTVRAPGDPKAFQRCGHMIGEPRTIGCMADEAGHVRWRLLEYALEKPQADPYDLVEEQYGSAASALEFETGLWVQVALRRLTEYRTPVAEVASRWNGDDVISIDDKPVSDLLEASLDPALVARAKEIARSIAQVRKQVSPIADQREVMSGERTAGDAKGPSRFRRVALPKDCPAPKSDANWKEPVVPATINRISEAEQFWRVETAGSLIVVVGQIWSGGGAWKEAGLGGVWIHISQDGGKTWTVPLYTDLEPNVYLSASANPCFARLDGDHLIIESWPTPHMEIDTAGRAPLSAAGPTEDRFAIDIPFSALKLDSDGDGLTDIVEEALLLDPRDRDSDGDGIVDGDDSFPNLGGKAASDLAEPMAAVLSGVVDDPGPSARAPEITVKAGVERLTIRFKERPLVLFADPRVFAGISADRMVLVFTADDMRRLAWRRSRISGTRFDEPVRNRARDRGYVKFDNGLTGGTFAWRREGAGWKVEQVSSFIR